MVSSGLLDRAVENARKNVAALIPHVEAGSMVVGCESSCILTLRDEYPDLLGREPTAQAVADVSVTLEQVLADAAADGGQQIRWRARSEEILLHVHCHARALVGTGEALAALNLPPNYRAELIDAGCCGMAGSFGYAKDHYDVSLQVGEDRLFPTLRRADADTRVAVTGVSCKQQIEDGVDRPARFLAEILAEAVDDR
jgi:Fe-S oxidoreductase